jgi:hypothetical protein
MSNFQNFFKKINAKEQTRRKGAKVVFAPLHLCLFALIVFRNILKKNCLNEVTGEITAHSEERWDFLSDL